MFAPIVLTMLSLAAKPAALPGNVDARGVWELAAQGEVVLLPRHQASPFSAWVFSRTKHRCDAVEQAILEVENYPKRWPNIREVRLLSRDERFVHYEFDIDLVFSPTLTGKIEKIRPGTVAFHDLETGGLFQWHLVQTPKGCLAAYQLSQPSGQQSGFVSLITAVESGAADSGEIAGAIASSRGYMKPELEGLPLAIGSDTAQRSWHQLSSQGTVLRLTRKAGHPTVYTSMRRSDRSPEQILAAIRNRSAYVHRLDMVKSVRTRDAHTQWEFGYFGGSVQVKTRAKESGSLDSPEGVVLTEEVVGGDLSSGVWRWHIRPVEGGTEVELMMDMDITSGSFVMRNLVEQHTLIRDASSLQLGLSMMGALVGGNQIPYREGAPVAVK